MHIFFQPWNRGRRPCSQSYSAEYGKKYTNSRFFYTKCNYYNKLILWIDSTDAYFYKNGERCQDDSYYQMISLAVLIRKIIY